jgi:hypothetical protein
VSHASNFSQWHSLIQLSPYLPVGHAGKHAIH